jgi:hypothetical protein
MGLTDSPVRPSVTLSNPMDWPSFPAWFGYRTSIETGVSAVKPHCEIILSLAVTIQKRLAIFRPFR